VEVKGVLEEVEEEGVVVMVAILEVQEEEEDSSGSKEGDKVLLGLEVGVGMLGYQ
jgi:hypothetical protein